MDAALAEASEGEADNEAEMTSQHQSQQASSSKPSASGTKNGSLDAGLLKRTERVSHASGLSARHTIKRPKAAHASAKQVLFCFRTLVSSLGLPQCAFTTTWT